MIWPKAKHGHRRRVAVGVPTALAVAAVIAAAMSSSAQTAPPKLEVKVLSNRADLISGGDALVEVVTPSPSDEVQVSDDGRDVTGAFARSADGRLLGVVTGLDLGRNVLTARLVQGGARASIPITNHARGGPVLAGPQVQPWICQTQENGFGAPQDEDCNVVPQRTFLYKSTTLPNLQAYDPANPPSDVAMTTTDEGVTVPFIVMQENGVVNRGWYSHALLYDPTKPFTPLKPQPGWNRKVVWYFGGSAGHSHYQGAPIDATSPEATSITTAGWDPVSQLGKGFALATGSLNIGARNQDIYVSADQVLMHQELIAEKYGPIRYVISTGCSGGSYQQYVIANAYPGLLDGIIPTCSYPDQLPMNSTDITVLSRYFTQTSPALWPLATQQGAVFGSPSPAGWLAAGVVFGDSAAPDKGCGGDDTEPWIYDAQTNPNGTRCTPQDHYAGEYGRRANGFGRRPDANEGIQYGLRPLLTGQISAEQFIDLNEKVGSLDIDGNWVPTRESGQDDLPVFTEVWRNSNMSDAAQLDQTPIIDVRGTSNFEFHNDVFSWMAKERIIRAHGDADNMAIFTHATSLAPLPQVTAEVFSLMDSWLTAIEADTSSASRADKVARNKPASVVDSCYVGLERTTDMDTCRQVYPYYSTVRIAAGQDLAQHVLRCQLKPLRREDYRPASGGSLLQPGGSLLTDAQWARLQKAFPTGVCDYSKPSVGRVSSVPWLRYVDYGVSVALGPPPTSAG